MPLYQQLVTDIRNNLYLHHSNDRLPSERELMKTYHVSRNTVRIALENLENRGLIYRIHGKGTFVAPIFVHQLDLNSMYSFSRQIRDLGKHPSTVYLGFKKIPARYEVARQLDLKENAEVFYLTRLRLADNEPMMYSRSYLPAKLFKGLTLEMLEQDSLYNVLRDKFCQTTMLAFEDVKATTLTDKHARLLQVPLGSPSLEIYRRTINDKNVAIEFTKTLARADKFIYRSRKYNDL